MKIVLKYEQGGVSMATSSIFANVIITDPIKAEAFIDALDAAADTPKEKKAPTNALVTDIEKIRAMMAKKKKG